MIILCLKAAIYSIVLGALGVIFSILFSVFITILFAILLSHFNTSQKGILIMSTKTMQLYWEREQPCFVCNDTKKLSITARSVIKTEEEPLDIENFTICETCVENLSYRMRLHNDNQWRKNR